MKCYEQLRRWRTEEINLVADDHYKLNAFHDQLMLEVVQIALKKVESEWGKAPSHFAFFVMGSAGRREQSIWSDQDHGIVYEASTDKQDYFLRVGEEISKGLSIVGYEQCDGDVMASNPFWCKSVTAWEVQILQWFEKGDWESLRYFLTFFDSRVLIGKTDLLLKLKAIAFLKLDQEPCLYRRFYENVSFMKKGIGILGQLLPEEKGEDTGTINLKKTTIFPYVNSLRLLALLEKIPETSTIERFQLLPAEYETIKGYQTAFINLLNERLNFQKQAATYSKVHLLQVRSMSMKEKEWLKEIMKKGNQLFKDVGERIEKRCSQ